LSSRFVLTDVVGASGCLFVSITATLFKNIFLSEPDCPGNVSLDNDA
jgi:hypothetical protein